MSEVKDKLITAENLKNAYDDNKRAISELKGDLEDVVKQGNNLFIKRKRIDNKLLNLNEDLFMDSSNYFTTEYIEVSANTPYFSYGFERYAEFDGNKVRIKCINISDDSVFTTSENAKYIMASAQYQHIDNLSINKGKFKYPYSDGKFVLDDKGIENLGISADKLQSGYPLDFVNGIEHGKNYFDKSLAVDGTLNMYGFLEYSETDVTSPFIKVEPNTNYYLKSIGVAYEYDKHGKVNDRLTWGGGKVTTSENACYIRFSTIKTNLDVAQMEEGNVFTGYEKFYRDIEKTVKYSKKVIVSNRANSIFVVSDKSVIVCGIEDYGTNSVFVNCQSDNTFRRGVMQWLTKDLSYPTNCHFFYKVVKFKNKIYATGKDETDSIWKIWRGQFSSDGTSIAWESNPVFVARNSMVTFHLACGFNCNKDYLFIGEYEHNEGLNPKAYRSADGTNWEEIITLSNSLHIHSIMPDPYVSGSVWLCSGEPEGQIYQSLDNGITWNKVVSEYGKQSCQISFSDKYVFFADDCGGEQSASVISKKTNTPFLLTNDIVNKFGVYGGKDGDKYFSNAFYGAVTKDGVYYGIIQDASSGGNVAGLFRVLDVGEHASIIGKLNIVSSPNNYNLLAELYETKDFIYFNQYVMYKTKVANLNEI